MEDKLKEIEGQPLSLPKICEKLGIEYKTASGARNGIIKELELYCTLEKQGRKYVVTNVHDKLLSPIHGNNKFQLYIEQSILNLLKNNNYIPIYLSKAELLEGLGLVNKNFKIAKSIDTLRTLGVEYYYLENAASDVANIFYPWVRARLELMSKRSLILCNDAIRVIKRTVKNGKIYHMKVNLSKFSEEEKLATEAIARARKTSLPAPLQQIAWIPPNYYKDYREALKKELKQTFGPEYIMAFRVLLLQSNETCVEMGLGLCQKMLNLESTRKIRKTRRLDYLTQHQRNRLTNEVIDISSTVSYSELAKQKRHEKNKKAWN